MTEPAAAPFGIPWSEILDPNRAQPQWLLKPWLLDCDQLLVISGDAGVGKTLMVATLALSLGLGRPFLGVPFSGEPSTVLYVDLDMGRRLTMDHWRRVCDGAGVGAADIDGRIFVASDDGVVLPLGMHLGHEPGGWKALGEALYRTEARWCIIEAFLDMLGGIGINDNNGINMLLSKLRHKWPGVGFVILQHEAKAKHDGDAVKTPMMRSLGAQALCKRADRHLALSPLGQNGAGPMVLVEFGKVRSALRPEPFRFAIKAVGDGVVLERCL